MYNYLEFNVTGDETLAHPEIECHRYCSAYNAQLRNKVPELEAKYWINPSRSPFPGDTKQQPCIAFAQDPPSPPLVVVRAFSSVISRDVCACGWHVRACGWHVRACAGICTCFNADACVDEWSFSPAWMEPAEGLGTDRVEPASNWTFTLPSLLPPVAPSGRPNRNYALISDAHVHVNAFFGGRYGVWANHAKALTWIRSLAVMTGHHLLILDARRGASAEYGNGYLARMVVDGGVREIDTPGTSAQLWPGAELAWVVGGKRDGNDLIDVYELRVANVVTLRVTLRPEIAAMRTATDGTVHMSIGVDWASLSPSVHGVLGQTFRPDFIGRLAQQKLVHSDLLHEDVVPGDNAEGFIDGTVKDYQVSALSKADCRFCRFARAQLVDEEMARALELTGGFLHPGVGVVGGGGYGMKLRGEAFSSGETLLMDAE
ncbi:unnamed protein product [Closterium sp. Yama58-4]|nr:unnamed protein product [Closterium sp. Yama58-4]